MTRSLFPRLLALAGASLLIAGAASRGAPSPASDAAPTPPSASAATPSLPLVDFERDIRPLLSENCFTCHGFDAGKRMAGLRLDTLEGATHPILSGKTAIVPKRPEQSEALVRIASASNPMPPAYSGKKLTAAQADLLRRWVVEGAPYGVHWAFVKPKRPALPAVKNDAWPRNAVDRFILARLERENLKPSPEADKATLIRRLSLELTGLPPTPKELDRFLADDSPDAYSRLVNRLLDSPHYGERMTLKWLDLARYADTHGFHIDSQRDMWRWRDWVIGAWNANMPYDEFVVEQVAGDLLPNATRSQIIATGFNRNHPINFEGGAIPEEYQAAYVHDRVDATSTTFMGLTAHCAQCHDHKYDPITQKDYYRLYAFFNTIAEQGLDGQTGNAAPFIKVPDAAQEDQLTTLTTKVTELEGKQAALPAQVAPAQVEWEKKTAADLQANASLKDGLAAWFPLDEAAGSPLRDASGRLTATVKGKADAGDGRVGRAFRFDGDTSIELGPGLAFDRGDAFSYGAWVYPTEGGAMTVLSHMDDEAAFRGWDLYLSDGKAFVHLLHEWEKNALRVATKGGVAPPNRWTHLFVTYDGSSKAAGVRIYVDGHPADVETTHDTLTDTLKTDKPARIGRRTPAAPFKGMIADARVYSRTLTPAEVERLAGLESLRPLFTVATERRTPAQKEALTRYYLDNVDPEAMKLNAELADARRKRDDLDAAIPTTMVMREMEKPRETHLLLRGQYDQLGEVVTPGTPPFLPPLPKGQTPNRLVLAQWLVNPNHPLTARVEVNRLWEMLFGTGLVKTSEDFGTRADPPSHPELLDWLATEFIRTGWDTKAMIRLMVNSATWRQSSRATPELNERDPENRLLAHAPRFRLPAELVRDQALAVSGLLVDKLGGPSVKPYQPAGLWEDISFKGGFSAQYYVQDHGEALYRRGMYTFWKRTVPPPTLQTFDAPEREYCIVRRSVTNTPLQALALQNDPTFVEASRKFAERIMTDGGLSDADRLRYGFRLLLCRAPEEKEGRILLALYNQEVVRFSREPEAAKRLLAVGESPCNKTLDARRLAAWTTVANTLFNMDEALTRG